MEKSKCIVCEKEREERGQVCCPMKEFVNSRKFRSVRQVPINNNLRNDITHLIVMVLLQTEGHTNHVAKLPQVDVILQSFKGGHSLPVQARQGPE